NSGLFLRGCSLTSILSILSFVKFRSAANLAFSPFFLLRPSEVRSCSYMEHQASLVCTAVSRVHAIYLYCCTQNNYPRGTDHLQATATNVNVHTHPIPPVDDMFYDTAFLSCRPTTKSVAPGSREYTKRPVCARKS
ncbi:unnamed protein product, partial [Ectocarpus fasciculatus]